MNKPLVSVIMPVYNAAPFVGEAVQSILAQTYDNFEFIIIDDASTDGSLKIIESFSDQRIKIFKNEINQGSAATMNRGMSLSAGEYIARMDADDISLSRRLEKQVAYLETHPNIGIVGAWVRVIGDTKEYVWKYETDPEREKCRTLFQCSLAFPAVMMRKKMLDLYGLRLDPEFRRAEDFELWARASHCFPIANLGEVLLHYRISSNQLSRQFNTHYSEWIELISQKQIIRLHIVPTEQELSTHNFISQIDVPPTNGYISSVDAWMRKLVTANDAYGVYDRKVFKSICAFYWYALLIRATHGGKGVFRQFWHSPLSVYIPLNKKITFLIKYLIRPLYAIKAA